MFCLPDAAGDTVSAAGTTDHAAASASCTAGFRGVRCRIGGDRTVAIFNGCVGSGFAGRLGCCFCGSLRGGYRSVHGGHCCGFTCVCRRTVSAAAACEQGEGKDHYCDECKCLFHFITSIIIGFQFYYFPVCVFYTGKIRKKKKIPKLHKILTCFMKRDML